MTVEHTLAHLVAFDSTSSRSNGGIIDHLGRVVEAAGMRVVERLSYLDRQGVEKVNIVAVAGASADKADVELALVGHTDTVPFDPAWSEALTLTVRDGKLYGRGACDTKGFIAAALTAVQETDLASLRKPLALVFTSDEEVGCLGAKYLADNGALRARYAIVGEPTSLQPMRAGKGYCLASVIVRGREGHSAYPTRGASAIFRAARLINELERIAAELKSRDLNQAFDPPYTSLNVGLVSGGTAKNIIAGECRFTLEWRPVPGQNPRQVLEMLDDGIARLKKLDDGFDCEVTCDRIDGGMETAADSPLVKFLEGVCGKSAGTVAFGTEGPLMIEMGAQPVVLGPGDIRVAHQTDEFVPVDELHRCVEILKRAIKEFCG
jgi:acetylornithine deacetylase